MVLRCYNPCFVRMIIGTLIFTTVTILVFRDGLLEAVYPTLIIHHTTCFSGMIIATGPKNIRDGQWTTLRLIFYI